MATNVNALERRERCGSCWQEPDGWHCWPAVPSLAAGACPCRTCEDDRAEQRWREAFPLEAAREDLDRLSDELQFAEEHCHEERARGLRAELRALEGRIEALEVAEREAEADDVAGLTRRVYRTDGGSPAASAAWRAAAAPALYEALCEAVRLFGPRGPFKRVAAIEETAAWIAAARRALAKAEGRAAAGEEP
jgi:hypothetical protein